MNTRARKEKKKKKKEKAFYQWIQYIYQPNELNEITLFVETKYSFREQRLLFI